MESETLSRNEGRQIKEAYFKDIKFKYWSSSFWNVLKVNGYMLFPFIKWWKKKYKIQINIQIVMKKYFFFRFFLCFRPATDRERGVDRTSGVRLHFIRVATVTAKGNEGVVSASGAVDIYISLASPNGRVNSYNQLTL
jgi:hypothetical protein